MNLIYNKVGAVGHHRMTLKDDSLKEEFENFISNQFIPTFNSVFVGQKILFCKVDRGKEIGNYLFLLLFDSKERRDTYYPESGETSDGVKELWNSSEIIKLNEKLNQFAEREFISDYIVFSNVPEFTETF